MSEESRICPYTGLRSFTEEESLYFKGRDSQIDQISRLLERNKFLMVTGASGEGKSSLIFAGLIPNARAGFFRARYNNWVVADFRPERTPVRNMAMAISKAVGSQASSAETELRRGFASLIDLYRNSELYIDESDFKWPQLPEAEKKSKKRNAANLLILVDQFEEFFTNPENFQHGVPSQDSQIVVNILLETARIALNENLPIYVVCTMRSDYIGQCSAFRDLPEYIGFSQFFVPRLKRKELKQIIEEPAVLSGNQITQRLVERLVYDLAEGIDQLPILQHALSQIWLVADHGREEMDLLHYAKVGGMPSSELPAEDKLRFDVWFLALPEYQRSFYNETGLDRVIELHANRLYEGAYEYYNQASPGHPITQRDAKNIIALTFACLTKIDNSRAVRNRMTLFEITQILNRPSLTTEVVGTVLNSFREESNSFIRPFKTTDPATHTLGPDSVLDITHESLIRNWGRLNKWANQEFEFYTTFLDFKKQLGRWLEHNKSRDYLLPIGPLSFFETWYAACKPNAYWIYRYVGNAGDSLEESGTLLENTRDFLRRSARKVIVTRTFMKYGANRIGAVIAIMLMIVMSGFYWYDADQKKNSRVIQRLRESGHLLMGSKAMGIGQKADYLIAEERFESGQMLDYLSKMEDYRSRVNLSLEALNKLVHITKHSDKAVKGDLIRFIERDLQKTPLHDLAFELEKRNLFISSLVYDNYYHASVETHDLIVRMASANESFILQAFGDVSNNKSGLSSRLNLGIHLWLTFGKPGKDKINKIIDLISPLSTAGAQKTFQVFYPKGNYESNYEYDKDYAGGYHTLAALYAAVGNVDAVNKCFDQFKETPNYFIGDYAFNNFPNIIGYLYAYGYGDKAPAVLQRMTSYTKSTEYFLMKEFVSQTGYMKLFQALNIDPGFLRSYRGYYIPNLSFLDESVSDLIWSDFEKCIMRLKDPAERNFAMALALKQRALMRHKYNFDQRESADDRIPGWLARSWGYFESLPSNYLDQKVSVKYRYYSDGKRSKDFTRRQQYLYPDHMGGWVNNTFHSDIFFNFITSKKEHTKYYRTGEDLNLFHYWIANAFEVFPRNDEWIQQNDFPLPDSTLVRILDIVKDHPAPDAFDTNLINMLLANRAFRREDRETALKYYGAVDMARIYSSANTYEYLNKTFVYNEVKNLSVNLAKSGMIKEAIAISEKFEKPYQVIFSYLFVAGAIYEKNLDPMTFVLLDSVVTKMKKIDLNTLDFESDFRFHLLHLLGEIGGSEVESGSKLILRELDENISWFATTSWCWGLAQQQNYYKAIVAIPPTFTDQQELLARMVILVEASREKERQQELAGWKEMDDYYFYEFNYVFFEPF